MPSSTYFSHSCTASSSVESRPGTPPSSAPPHPPLHPPTNLLPWTTPRFPQALRSLFMRTAGPSPLAAVCEWRQPVRADGPVMFLQPLTRPTFANRNEPLARGGAGQWLGRSVAGQATGGGRRVRVGGGSNYFVTLRMKICFGCLYVFSWLKSQQYKNCRFFLITFLFKRHKSCSKLFTF